MVEGLCGLTVPSSGFRVRVLRYRVRRHHWTFDSTAGPFWGSACALSLSPKKRGCIHRFHSARVVRTKLGVAMSLRSTVAQEHLHSAHSPKPSTLKPNNEHMPISDPRFPNEQLPYLNRLEVLKRCHVVAQRQAPRNDQDLGYKYRVC